MPLSVRTTVFSFSSMWMSDERGARLVDEDGVHLVHYGEVKPALHFAGFGDHHVVAQEIEAQLVVGAVGDVAVVCPHLFLELHIMGDDAHGESQIAEHLAHPRRVTTGEILVDGDDVHALPRQRVEVGGHGGDQRLAFTRAHLGYPALMQCDAAHDLHEEGVELDHPPRRLTHGGEGFRKDVIQSLALGKLPFEPLRLGDEILLIHRLILGGKHIDLSCYLSQPAQLSFVFVENGCHCPSFPRIPGRARRLDVRARALPLRALS